MGQYYGVLDYGVVFTKDDLDFEKVKKAFDNVDFTDIDFEKNFELCEYFDGGDKRYLAYIPVERIVDLHACNRLRTTGFPRMG